MKSWEWCMVVHSVVVIVGTSAPQTVGSMGQCHWFPSQWIKCYRQETSREIDLPSTGSLHYPNGFNGQGLAKQKLSFFPVSHMGGKCPSTRAIFHSFS